MTRSKNAGRTAWNPRKTFSEPNRTKPMNCRKARNRNESNREPVPSWTSVCEFRREGWPRKRAGCLRPRGPVVFLHVMFSVLRIVMCYSMCYVMCYASCSLFFQLRLFVLCFIVLVSFAPRASARTTSRPHSHPAGSTPGSRGRAETLES